MNKVIALALVAAAGICRTIWAFDAIYGAPDLDTASPWFVIAFVIVSGSMSLALLGLVMRAVLGFHDARTTSV